MRYLILFFISIYCISCDSEITYPIGGYNYPDPKTNIDTDDYSFPLRGTLSTRDSFNYGYYERYWHHGYDEPNLSIKYQGQDIFRLTFRAAFGDAAIITILKDKLISKRRVKGDPYPEYDSARLTSIERHLYEILYWNFPLQDRIKAGRKSLDSLAKVYPQILDPVYYRTLLDKCLVPNNEHLEYKTTVASLSRNQYNKIVNHINSSGYWTMPYEVECTGYAMPDGFGITLEASTPNKYNIVFRFGCPTDKIDFLQVCQEILDAAKLEKPIRIISNK